MKNDAVEYIDSYFNKFRKEFEKIKKQSKILVSFNI